MTMLVSSGTSEDRTPDTQCQTMTTTGPVSSVIGLHWANLNG
ncbi:hypothetical protein [Amycolatopsis thailandensis]|nr:hypothetical protein [Amycolatopsis thailandensis]